MNIFEKLKSFFQIPSSSRTLALIGILIVLVALPVIVVIAQQQTQIQQHADIASCSQACINGNNACQNNCNDKSGYEANCANQKLTCESHCVGPDENPICFNRCNNQYNACINNFSSFQSQCLTNCPDALGQCQVKCQKSYPVTPVTTAPTTTDTCTSSATQNTGKGYYCAQRNQCISANGAQFAPSGSGTCPNSSTNVCCMNLAVTPAPAQIPCSKGYQANGISYTCTDFVNKKETCGTSFLGVATDCGATKGTGSLCCPTTSIVSPCTCQTDGKIGGSYTCLNANNGTCAANEICTNTVTTGSPCKRIDSLKQSDFFNNAPLGVYGFSYGFTPLGAAVQSHDVSICFDSQGSTGVCMFTAQDPNLKYTPYAGARCGGPFDTGAGCTDINSAWTCQEMTSKYFNEGSSAYSVDPKLPNACNINAGALTTTGNPAPANNVVKCCILNKSAATSATTTPTPTPDLSKAQQCKSDNGQTGICVYSKRGGNPSWTIDPAQKNIGLGQDFSCSDLGSYHDIPTNLGSINLTNASSQFSQQCTGAIGAPVRCCAPNGGGPGGPSGPACTNGLQTSFALDIKLDGIGPGTFENNNPAHPNRNAAIVVKDDSGNTIFGQSHDFSQQANEDKGKGRFGSAGVDLGVGKAVCGKKYTATVKVPGYLPAPVDITYGQTNQVIQVEPIPGDINIVDATTGIVVGDDKINNLDYQIFAQCHVNQDPDYTLHFANPNSTTGPSIDKKCRDLINLLDYQDGGTQDQPNSATGVDEFAANYNLWLRGFLKANGQ